MRWCLSLLLSFLLQQCVLAAAPARRNHETHNYYALEHDPSQNADLDECLNALGVDLVEQIGELKNHWLVRRPKSLVNVASRGASDPVMDRFEELRSRASPHAPSTLRTRAEHAQHARRLVSSIRHLSPQTLRQRTKRAPPPVYGEPSEKSIDVASRLGFSDPLFTSQWHIVNDDSPENMMNVTPVWEMGITGQGIITTMVDDGLDYTSEDLASNFDAADSYNFNDHEDLPTPKLYDDTHGTRCAGQIAAAKNDACGVGLAYESKIAGVRILSGPISDVDEAAALNYGYQNVSIYSCSWGPPDDGRSMDGPGYLIQKAVLNGVENGRDGKGSIFVFASGNGASYNDQCNFDGYTNSIYSVTVSAVDYKGLHPYYSEPCAANMIVTYSSGGGHSIVTTDKGKNKCSSNHGGTSAAAPNAAGVFALALQARPDLGWRDIQYLCVRTSKMINPDDPDWETTAAGGKYSYKYGYGRLDAHAFVTAAQEWELVKPQAWYHPPAIQINNGTMDVNEHMQGGLLIPPEGLTSTVTVTQEMLEEHNFEALEHLTIRVWISHTKRGDVEVELVSPNGIKSVLAAKRMYDRVGSGFPGWRFMSVKHWGENPVGTWTIKVSDQKAIDQSGTFHGWRLMFWGSTIDPSKARTYDLPVTDTLLPSVEQAEDAPDLPVPTTSKFLPKPTAGLPDDHDTAEGEADKPAFPGSSSGSDEDDTVSSPTTSSTPSMTPTPDQGWFSGMSNLLHDQKWFFGALGAVLLFGVAVGVFFWRRRVRRRQALYAAVKNSDNLAMSSVSRDGRIQTGAAGTRELYDAFGEVSDDDDADEETGLRPNGPPSRGSGYHSGFLDDDEDAIDPAPIYRDEPQEDGVVGQRNLETRSTSPTSGSGDGSWEHASQTR